MSDEDIIKEALEEFELAEEAENDNRRVGLDDVKFSRLGEHWPEEIKKQRQIDGRPCLTVNKFPAFIRQVTNDARLNKPSIKTRPVDSFADVKTAEVFNGLIRNIEYTSDADTAYDTGIECAADRGIGYWLVDIDYAHDDTFDLDIQINRVTNPFAVYGDPASTAADSSDWNTAFHVDRIRKAEFKRQWPDAEKTDWNFDFQDTPAIWHDEEFVMVADWWKREEVEREIVLLSDGTVVDADRLEKMADVIEVNQLTVTNSRMTKGYKVKRYKLTGAEVLSTDDWPGRYIPIIPIYGEDFDIEGKRYNRSLIHNAKDAARMFDFWRTAGTELTALAPKVPFIGPKGAFDSDAEKWANVNTASYSHIEYDVVPEAPGGGRPQRQPMDMGVAAGALQESLNASDDMKSIIGLHDASLGARSNEVSGVAINARQREGDVSTFHFQDNQSRAIKHTGRIIIDLIPHVYNKPRIIRVLGEDGKEASKPINQDVPATDDDDNPIMEPAFNPDGTPAMEPVLNEMGEPVINQQTRQPVMRQKMQQRTEMYDLTVGKYDLVVTPGPSFTTRREEAASQMMDLVRSFPAAAQVMGDLIAKNLDWPGADEIAKRLEKLLPQNVQDNIPPEIQKTLEEGAARIKQLETENEQMKADRSFEAQELRLKNIEAEIKKMLGQAKASTDQFKAETERAEVVNEMRAQQQVPRYVTGPYQR